MSLERDNKNYYSIIQGHNIVRKHKKRGITVVLWFLFPYNVGCRRCCAEVPFKSGHANIKFDLSFREKDLGDENNDGNREGQNI